MAEDSRENDPEALALLLPFYVNGTLAPDDRARVEAALGADPALRAELAEVEALAGLVRRGGGALADGADSDAQGEDRLQALMARIDAPPALGGERRRRPFRREASGPARSARAPGWIWKPAFAAAAVLAVIEAGAVVRLAQPPAAYHSLSGPEAPAPAHAARLLVKLSPDAKWAEVETLLLSVNATIVGGPRGDTLDLALGEGMKTEDAVKRLKASPLVAFAAPAS